MKLLITAILTGTALTAASTLAQEGTPRQNQGVDSCLSEFPVHNSEAATFAQKLQWSLQFLLAPSALDEIYGLHSYPLPRDQITKVPTIINDNRSEAGFMALVGLNDLSDPVGVGIEIGHELINGESPEAIVDRIDDSDECPTTDCNLYLVSRYPVTSFENDPKLVLEQDMCIDTNEIRP